MQFTFLPLLDLELKIHSLVADSYPTYIKLWYVCRALDIKGSGLVTIDLKEIAQQLNLNIRTVKEYLKKGSCLYRETVKVSKLKYKVYLKSLLEVTNQRGLPSFGTVAWITVKELLDIKVTSTEIVAQSLQQSSRYLATKEQRNLGSNRTPYQPETLFDGTNLLEDLPSSELCAGALGFSSKYNTLFVNQGFVHFGGSQETISKKLYRHPKTVQRRLKNSIKLRLAKFNRTNYIEQITLADDCDANAGRFIKINYFNESVNGKTFKLLTNVYYPNYMLTSMATRRKEYNRFKELTCMGA